MDQLDTGHLLAIAAALGWASGLRLYAVLFIVGGAGTLGWVDLPRGLELLQHPLMLGASGFMFAMEFFADKIPLVDSVWDIAHALLRIPAAAALAASVFGADQATWAAVAALLGGSLAATSQAAKTSSRAAVNTSPEPFSNIVASLVEDGLVVGLLWLAWAHPLVFAVVMALLVVLAWVLIALLWKLARASIQRARQFFGGAAAGQGQ